MILQGWKFKNSKIPHFNRVKFSEPDRLFILITLHKGVVMYMDIIYIVTCQVHPVLVKQV